MPPPEDQGAEKEGQKPAVEPRHRRDVHQPGFGEVRFALLVQPLPLPGEEGGDEPRRPGRIEPLRALPQGLGEPLG